MLIGILLVPVVLILPAILRYIIIKKSIHKVPAIIILVINAIIIITALLLLQDQIGVTSKSGPSVAVAIGSFMAYNFLQN